ncbi:MAG: hypothetical protein AMS26_23405 [Bacteroides sp. SM23_62]|nr:MAG: hypothetical protein AMS26_23405 [Bacteroides sp. SM23_62]
MEQEKTRKFIDWRPSDKGDTVGWALIFVWAAFLILAPMLNIGQEYSWWDGWGLFFIGLGVVGLAGSLIRLSVKEYPNPSLWDIVFGLFFLFLGLGNNTSWIWAIALIVIGFSILRSVHQHHKST